MLPLLFKFGKQSPWYLSFEYTSQVRLTFRTVPKFGKYLGNLFYILTFTPSYAAWNQDWLASTTFSQRFLTFENTHENCKQCHECSP